MTESVIYPDKRVLRSLTKGERLLGKSPDKADGPRPFTVDKTRPHASDMETGPVRDDQVPPPDFLGVCNIPFHVFVKKEGQIPTEMADWCFKHLKDDVCLRTGSTVFFEHFKKFFGESIYDAYTPSDGEIVLFPQDYDFVFNIRDLPKELTGTRTIDTINESTGWKGYYGQEEADPDENTWRCYTSGKYVAEITRLHSIPKEGKEPVRVRQDVWVNLILCDDAEYQAFKLATESIKIYMEKNRHRPDLLAEKLLTKAWRAAFFEGVRTFLFTGSRDV